MLAQMQSCGRDYEALHANYWLSGQVAHRLKHELSLPMVATFHTLARVNGTPDGGASGAGRAAGRGRDHPLRRPHPRLHHRRGRPSCGHLYGADPDRIEVLPPGVDHRVFSPGRPRAARARLGHPGERVAALRRPRSSRLKGSTWPCECLAEIDDARPVGGGRPERPRRAGRARPGPEPGRPTSAWPTGCCSSPRAPPPAGRLLPGGRRVPRPVPHRVLRAGGPGGGRLRHPGGGRGGRRAPLDRRRRRHRLPGRGP